MGMENINMKRVDIYHELDKFISKTVPNYYLTLNVTGTAK